jgi:hypothetical protein
MFECKKFITLINVLSGNTENALPRLRKGNIFQEEHARDPMVEPRSQ